MTNHRPHLLGLLAGLFLAAGLVIAAMLVTRAWLRIAEAHTVTVTGSARLPVRSDLIVWRGSFSAEAPALLDAQRQLKKAMETVDAFLRNQGLTNYFFSPIAIQQLRAGQNSYDEGNRTVGYRLTQGVVLESKEVDRITQLDRDSTALVEAGVVFTTSPVEYIYTKAAEAKVSLLAEATGDARARATQIASQGGRTIGGLRSARMGVFQITARNSVETSSEGVNDVSSLDKTITAVVSATFSLK
jgi:hypothetical protein